MDGQYIKQETIEDTPQGKVARAVRQISERASTRIGRMAFEIALAQAEIRAQRKSTYGWQVGSRPGVEGGAELMQELRDLLRLRLCTSPTSSLSPMASSARACAPSLETTLVSWWRSRLWIRSSTGPSLPPPFNSRFD